MSNVLNLNSFVVPKLKIKCWNINGNLAINLSHPNFLASLSSNDVNFFQETHLRPQQHESLPLPVGYEIFAIGRKPPRSLARPWGGVVTIIRTSLLASHRKDLSGPDLLVLDLGSVLLFNSYILPDNSPWDSWSQIHPLQKLRESLSVASASGKSIILLGDLNGRIGDLPNILGPYISRISCDKQINTRGRIIMGLIEDFELCVLNGIAALGASNSEWTSYQGANGSSRRSVIDYCLCSLSALSSVIGFTIGTNETWSDHAALLLAISWPTCVSVATRPLKSQRTFVALPQDTILDRLLVRTLHSELSPDDALLRAYGPVSNCSVPYPIYTDGSCFNNGLSNARAGAGVFFGVRNSLNFAGRVPGAQTNNRGELLAILYALVLVSPSRTVHIFSDSEYAIKSIAFWGPNHAMSGWSCANGDILRNIAMWLRHRTAALHFIWIEAHCGNQHGDAADLLAKRGASMLPHLPIFVPLDPPVCNSTAPDCPRLILAEDTIPTPKVSASICESSLKLPVRKAKIDSYHDDSHRGRSFVRALQRMNLQRLVDASPSAGLFWKVYRQLADAKPFVPSVSAPILAETFCRRMNPLPILPTGFDKNILARNKSLADSIPKITIDHSENQIFSSPWTESDIEWAKNHIKSHPGGSSRGLDQSSYTQILGIDNTLLCTLFNECMIHNDGPSIWFSTLITAILKKGKSATDAESYRTIALESCLLKVLTLLIHKRVYEYAESNHIIPHSQNGFREGFRTNNNAFVLRCLIERARADSKTLYVGFVDISNAFPSTEHSTLWLKLMKMGISGKVFDWLRMLYEKMSYMVSIGDTRSDSFKSLMGVLIGDPLSPTLWNLYLADFGLDAHHDDVALMGIIISHLEHADDMALASYSSAGLQSHFDSVFRWCCLNFLIINAIKSWIMIFGALPLVAPVLHLGPNIVTFTKLFSYVGVMFQSTTRNIFAAHYSAKSDLARRAGHGILGVESLVHILPPWEARLLYTARLDPHLISGCEVIIDIDPPQLALLTDVQHNFLRRILHIGRRSPIAPLFTELGLMPLRFRRLILALRYLSYLLALPSSYYARAALMDSFDLHSRGLPCWVTDLALALYSLPTPVTLPRLSDLSEKSIMESIKEVRRSGASNLQREIDLSTRLYLLHGRLETPDVDKPARQITMWFRHYLHVQVPPHRIALTRLLLSSHCLAIERLRWSDRYHPAVDRMNRICRLCSNSVESPEHTMLLCDGSLAVQRLRNNFLGVIYKELPWLGPRNENNSIHMLKGIVSERSTIDLTAKYVFDVLSIFDSLVLVRPVLQPASVPQ